MTQSVAYRPAGGRRHARCDRRAESRTSRHGRGGEPQ
jgi:hypothetical protein